jgi:Cu+-exporting ATPase
VEASSEHPLADAIVKRAHVEGLDLLEIQEFNSFGGKGVTAVVDGKKIVIGNRSLLKDKNIPITNHIESDILQLEREGKTVVIMGMNGVLSCLIAVADTLKESTINAIGDLKKMGLNVVMITGDNARTAAAIGLQVGIERVISEVLPQDKSAEVKRLQDDGEVVAFVGDGINDAPALAQADVGIAIGSGTDVAIESGDIVLIKDDLMDAVAGIQISKKVMSRIKQNLFWAFAYNVVLIPVAAGILYPSFGIMFRPEYAGLAMALSSVTVVSLSLMLKGYIPPAKKLKKNKSY